MIGGLGHGSSISHLWHLNFRWLRLNQPSKLRSTGAAGVSGSPAFFRPRDHTHVWIAGQLDSWDIGVPPLNHSPVDGPGVQIFGGRRWQRSIGAMGHRVASLLA